MEDYIGIDVFKKLLDVSLTERVIQFNNSIEGVDELFKTLSTYKKDFKIICEATGGYEKKLIEKAKIKNVPIYVANAKQVRDFAKAKGQLAKTDKIDAKLISEFGKMFKPIPTEFYLSEQELELRDLLRRQAQLIEQKQQEKNRLDKNGQSSIQHSIEEHVTWLENELKRIEVSISKLINSIDSLKAKVELLNSIPGVGLITSATVLTELPEIGSLAHRKAYALAGVAPFNNDSGKKLGNVILKEVALRLERYCIWRRWRVSGITMN